jgi:hypothetical protein
MQLILIVEAMEANSKKFVTTPIVSPDDDAMHQWAFLMKKRPNVHVEAIKLGGHRIAIKLDAP